MNGQQNFINDFLARREIQELRSSRGTCYQGEGYQELCCEISYVAPFLLFQLLKCSNFIEREMNTILRQSGLKQQQFAVLNEIMTNGPLSQRELADNLLFGKSNTSRIVKILSEKRLIQVTSAPIDKRLTLLIETPEGAILWRNCIQILNERCAEHLPSISGGDIKNTFDNLRMLGKSLSIKRKSSF